MTEKYMLRALQLARKGLPYAMPNPMVGAVIVAPDGTVIGEGYHRRCGEAHAEVNAIADFHRRYGEGGSGPYRLDDSTMYVTLEPCAHYGRTGPCARLIIDKRIPRVVVGTRDPFEKVDGKGIEMLRAAGVEVSVGLLEHECRALNAIFFTAHTEHRPFVILKWAQSADGYIDARRTAPDSPAARISSPLTSVLSHQLRAVCDAILVGSNTVLADNPTLTTRLWPGKSPVAVVLDRRGRIEPQRHSLRLFATDEARSQAPMVLGEAMEVSRLLGWLYRQGITSLLVEGGAQVLEAFIGAGCWDLARVECSPHALGSQGSVEAPSMGHLAPLKTESFGLQTVKYYSANPLIDVKNL